MDKRLTPLIVIGVFWLALFLFVTAGYSNSIGITTITGNVINANGTTTPVGAQSLVIVVLFFTNLVTIFFLIRAYAEK